MATKAYHIELRVTNVDTPERMLAIRKALQSAAAGLHAKAVLITMDSGSDPEIIIYGEDLEEGRRDIPTQDEGDAA